MGRDLHLQNQAPTAAGSVRSKYTMFFLLETLFLLAMLFSPRKPKNKLDHKNRKKCKNFGRAIQTEQLDSAIQISADGAILVATSGEPKQAAIAPFWFYNEPRKPAAIAPFWFCNDPRIPAAKAPYLFSDGTVLSLNRHMQSSNGKISIDTYICSRRVPVHKSTQLRVLEQSNCFSKIGLI